MEYSSAQFNYLSSLFGNSTGYISPLNIEDKCLQCNQIISPKVVDLYTFDSKTSSSLNIGVLLFCQNCKHFFVREYNAYICGNHFEVKNEITKPYDLECNIHVSENINEISPRFKEIYSQSAKAESCNLYEICGPGYRKALEFLIRDFAKYINPEKKEAIDHTVQLGQVINNFYDEKKLPVFTPIIKMASAIGNDETHYTRKWENQGIDDLKQHIVLATNIIDAYLNSIKDDSLMKKHKK